MRKDLINIKEKVLKQGRLSQEEYELLRTLFVNKVATREDMDFLFFLNDSLAELEVCPEFEDWFVDTTTNYMLDGDSFGEISEDKAYWLRAKIRFNGSFDNLEKRLLENLRLKALSFPSVLEFKSRSILMFESVLFGVRFTTYLAVIGSMIASVVLFVASSLKVWEGLKFALNYSSSNHSYAKEQVVYFVEAVDGYLFATVLIIFSIGLYELFIDKVDPVSLKNDSRPNWLRINSIDDLKSSLGKVILMILIVSFFEHSVGLHYTTALDLLYLGLGILFVSGALYLTHKKSN